MMVQVNLLHWYVIEFRLIDQENDNGHSGRQTHILGGPEAPDVLG